MARLLVNASLAALRSDPLEVLHHICHVDFCAVDSYLGEHLIQQSASGSNKRMACFIFAVSGLLSHEHHSGSGRTFSEYGLGAEFPKIAGFAGPGGLLQSCERW